MGSIYIMRNMKLTSRETNDYIYYNVKVSNPEDSNTIRLCKFDETRVRDILKTPWDYDMAVARFDIPSSTLPIWVWPGDDQYEVSLEWQGTTVTSFVTYAGDGNAEAPYGLSINTYQGLSDVITEAIQDCSDQLAAIYPGPGLDWLNYAGPPPKMAYNPETNIFEFRVPYDTPDGGEGNWTTNQTGVPDPNDISLNFSRSLARVMRSFQTRITNDPSTYYQLLIKDNGNNVVQDQITPPPPREFVMYQQYVALYDINDFDSLIFRTNRIPVNSELDGGQRDANRHILTDFKIRIQEYIEGTIQYEPRLYRYYPLMTNSRLREIDLQVFWQDKKGTERPLYLDAGETATVKIQFRRKSHIKGSEDHSSKDLY